MFPRFYAALALLFCVCFIAYDWAYPLLWWENALSAEESRRHSGEGMREIAAELSELKATSAGDRLLAAASDLLESADIAMQPSYELIEYSILENKDMSLSLDQRRRLMAGEYLVTERSSPDSWSVQAAIPNKNMTLEAVFKEQGDGGSFYSWLAGYVVLYLSLLAVVLYLLLASVKRPLRESISQVSAALRRINGLFNGPTGPVQSAATPAELLQQASTVERHIAQEKESRARHYDDLRDLLHGVAHEFRSPMARISFALDLADDETDKSDPNAQNIRALHQEISGALDELSGLVKEVLSYSRLEHGRGDLQCEPVAVMDVVEEILAKQRKMHPQVEFVTPTEPAMQEIQVWADRRLFSRALVNLIRNAARFADHSVRISWRLTDAHFEIQVDDDGPGVPPGKRQRVFEPFTRLDPSRSRDSGGAGLGLAIVKSISTLHGGTVSVTDSRQGGACFTLCWPKEPTQ
ncbi:ATP-binding protein [Hahella aquimaris]|uniref:sensor histidine kinase n=1 Tax=Hahella sp. HNIBRBA332 TaxID=3015983 RepID=UPI00273B7D96|nr:ATP-binding protein [Hahella sp. HNIBRBA332]WLQ13175.1 ATP-binding protein [Hahella sp. HNIBRBA332]